MEYAQACVGGMREARGLGDVCVVFLCGSVFGHAALEDRRFDRIYVGASCPKLRLRNLLRLLKQGGRIVVACEGQLLLLTQPADGGPVPEPTVLGALPATEALVDDALPVWEAPCQMKVPMMLSEILFVCLRLSAATFSSLPLACQICSCHVRCHCSCCISRRSCCSRARGRCICMSSPAG